MNQLIDPSSFPLAARYMGQFPDLHLEGREAILTLERAVGELTQYLCPLRHHFADGIYVREISIPRGCVLVGYIHMFPCITIISQGVIAISGGDEPVTLRAPYTIACAPGSKKAGYALEDVIWSDVYANPTNERDIEKLEKILTAGTHAEFLERTEQRLRLEGNKP